MFTVKLICKNVPSESESVLRKALARRLEERLCALSDDGFPLTVTLKDNGEGEYYTITGDSTKAEVIASDIANAFAGVGRYLVLGRFDGNGNFSQPDALPVTVNPKCSIRGMYFATHFYNFYHAAPIEEVYCAIEDLALRGCNALMLCFGIQHYTSFKEPAALTFIAKMKQMFSYGDLCGLAPALILFSNSGFIDAPEELLADQRQQGIYTHGMHYVVNCDICPSKPGGMDYIKDTHRQFFEAFADTPIKYFAYWPYDEGGCTCDACSPWSTNAFIKISEHCIEMIKEYGYDAKLILSTWHFDRRIDGEWDMLYEHLKKGDYPWAEYVMTCFQSGNPAKCLADGGVPEGRHFIDFPEISMYCAKPWGGYGTNPLTLFLDNAAARCYDGLDGGFPYSEGIFEDVNKWLCLTYYTGLYENTTDALRDYLRFEFCCPEEYIEELVRAYQLMEMSIKRSDALDKETGIYKVQLQDARAVREVLRIVKKIDQKLPEQIRKNWRWRIVVIRAEIDAELYRVGYVPKRSELIQKNFAELIEMFHLENGLYDIKPPLGK